MWRPKWAHGLGAHAVVGNGFDEGVLGASPGEGDAHRPSLHDVAALARVGMAPAVGGQVHHHHVGPGAGALGLALEHLGQGVGGVGLEALGPPRRPGRFAGPGGLGLGAPP